MKLRILASARRDLIEGYRFYHKHGEGVGAYFLDSLFSEIDSLVLNAGAHPVFSRDITGLSREGFHLPCITGSKTARYTSTP